jgi:hypothetical protein
MPLIFSLGIPELLVLAGLILPGLLVVMIVLFFVLRKPGNMQQRWSPPGGVGTPTQIRAIQPSDPPLAPSARWQGSELFIRAHEPSTKALFDIPLSNLEQCLITYRFQIQTDGNRTTVYPELWCRLPERGQFFSRGVDRKIRETKDWTPVEIPFYLANGQQADLLHLNLVFEQPGAVRIKDIEVLAAPTKS